MIVKKMPILQGFPDFETVKKLTKSHGFQEHFVPLFQSFHAQADFFVFLVEINYFCVISCPIFQYIRWFLNMLSGNL